MSEQTICASAESWLGLLCNARLNLPLASGEGLGAFLLAAVVIAFLFSAPFKRARLNELILSWRGWRPNRRAPKK